jgi:hypothetical protein
MTTFRIIRFFRESYRQQVIAIRLTLEQAQAHCNDPETSSSTCTSAEGKRRTEKYGPWFDTDDEESPYGKG